MTDTHPIFDLPTGAVTETAQRCPFTTLPMLIMTRETFDLMPTAPQSPGTDGSPSPWWRNGPAACSAGRLGGHPQPEQVVRDTGKSSFYGREHQVRVAKIL